MPQAVRCQQRRVEDGSKKRQHPHGKMVSKEETELDITRICLEVTKKLNFETHQIDHLDLRKLSDLCHSSAKISKNGLEDMLCNDGLFHGDDTTADSTADPAGDHPRALEPGDTAHT